MKNLGKQLTGLGILLFSLAMLFFIGCPSGSKSASTQSYTVTFDTNGGTPSTIKSVQVEKGKTMGALYPADPAKNDFDFAGWYLAGDTGFSGGKYESTTVINANTALKARWIEKGTTIEYWTVTFDTNGGDPAVLAGIQVEKGKTMGIQYPTDPEKDGFEFAGWYLAGDTEFSGGKYEATTVINADTDLKARWNQKGAPPIEYWTVTFDTNGGTPSTMPNIQVEKGKTMGTQYPADPEKDGFEFDGWYLASDTGFGGTKYSTTTVISANTNLKAKWLKLPDVFNINFAISGNATGDSVTASPESGQAGTKITLNYTLANDKENNRLVFTGTKAAIAQVDSAETGTREYTINAEDAAEKVITINATFTHSDKTLDIIAFADTNNVTKIYGDASFTRAVTITGAGSGAISYASSEPSVATVNSGSGAVTILAAGTTEITATKAEDANYAGTTAAYTLTVEKKSITITGLSAQNKVYDGETGATVTGTAAIEGKLGSDALKIIAGTASFANKNAGTGKTVTFSGYSLDGATKDNYELSQPANVTANITVLQLTIANPVLTTSKTYDGNTTANVTAGALSNKINGDTVNVSAAGAYNAATVAEANLITVVYSITGADAINYIKPADYTIAGTITKAAGGTVSAPTKVSTTSTSITINAVTAPATGQVTEYAIATTTNAPSTGWQDGLTFNGLTANTDYYIFARAKANDNYNAGAAVSTQIKTDAASSSNAVTTVINFEADAIDKTYDYTEGDNKPTSVKVVADPINSGKKSLQISSNGPNNDKGYNQAAVIPVKLPYTVKDYQSFSFKFSLVSGNTGTNLDSKQIHVYIAKDKAAFKKYGFGNGASESNQFAANLIGAAPSSAVNFDSSYVGKWTDYSITVTNPGDAIKDLTGDLFIAIGINCKTNAVYLFDDITFTPKSNFVPPPPPPEPPTTAPNPPSIGAVSSKNYRNMFKEWGYSDAEITNKVNTSWNKLFVSGTADEKIYVETGSDMAYIYTADTDDVRSEGMSYGMMMCVQMDDQVRFNKLWKWSKTYMYNPTTNAGNNNRGYFAWQCNTNGTRKDQSPAPDGEAYFVTALLFASARWGDGTGDLEYGKWARKILYDMVHRTSNNTVDPYGAPTMFDLTEKQVVFVPYGNSASHTDPSYHLPSFYEIWALELENDWKNNKLYDTTNTWKTLAELKTDIDFYKQTAITSRSFFQKTTNSTTGLGPDYAAFSGAPTGGNHADFRFDAWRIAMNIGMDYAWWAADSWQKTFADRIQAFFVSKGVTTYKNQWKLDGTVIEGDHSPGLVGCNAVASLAATHVNAWKFIEDFWNISMTTGKYRYYDGCLYMMCMLHLSGNFKAYLSTNTTPIPSSSINPTTATFDKKTGSQADISVTMTLNGNTLTNIKNGSVVLTSGTDYTQSGSSVTIKTAYLAAQAVGTTTLTFTFSAGSTQNLVITITDTSNSSISPTSATFDKRSDLQADIAVTMTLNGNNLTGISNGATTLPIYNQYTVSNSTVTIKKEYLAAQAVGTTTLVFTFNAGATSSLAITVKESPAGTGAGTSYNFATDSIPAGYPTYSASNTGTVSATITGGVLQIVKSNTNHSTPYTILPFDLGTGNLSEYSSIKIRIRGVSDDYTNKGIRVYLGNTRIENSGNASLSTTFQDKTLTLTGSRNATGNIELGFGLEQTQGYTIEIASIELIK